MPFLSDMEKQEKQVFLKLVRDRLEGDSKMETLHFQINKALKDKLTDYIPAIKKILLIDHDKDSVLSAALSQERYEVIHCPSVQKAWSFVYPYPPHLIIIHLDELDRAGLTDLQECWALAEGVPVILATAPRVNRTLMEALHHRIAGVLDLSSMLKTITTAPSGLDAATMRR